MLSTRTDTLTGSSSAQVSHQALGLIADLARLAPDSVLGGVMPIFTFMGSNVFHRDDAYSFKVVEQVRAFTCVMPYDTKKNFHS